MNLITYLKETLSRKISSMLPKIILINTFIIFTILYFLFLSLIYKTDGSGILVGGNEFIPESITGKERKGVKGEQIVNHNLRLLLKKNEYLLSNVFVPSNDGLYYEIDSILISNKGVFCIETKSWRGNVSGGNKDNYWIQSYFDKNKIYNKIHNPVIQNQTHCEILEEILDFKYPVDNIVIFSNQSNLKCVQSKSVFTFNDFKKCYLLLEKDQLSKRQILNIVDKLVPYITNVIA